MLEGKVPPCLRNGPLMRAGAETSFQRRSCLLLTALTHHPDHQQSDVLLIQYDSEENTRPRRSVL